MVSRASKPESSMQRKTSQKYKKNNVELLRRMLLSQSYNRLVGLRLRPTARLRRSAKPCRTASLAPSWTTTPRIALMFILMISIGWASKLIMKTLQRKKMKWEKPAISNNKLTMKHHQANLTRRAWVSYCLCPNSNWKASNKANQRNQTFCWRRLLPQGRQELHRVARFLNRRERRPSRSQLRRVEITVRPNRKSKNQLEKRRKCSKMEFKCLRCPREAKWNTELKRTIKS